MLQQSVAYNCTPCATNEFSLEAGSLVGGEVKAIECITDCPYGGDCRQGGAHLLARPGFFGALGRNTTQKRSDGTEFFAPNLAVQVVNDEATAMDICMQSAFGLSMSVFSGDRSVFERFAESVPCGLFNWNRSTNNASGLLPFGGLGYSGNHRSAGSTSALYCSRPVGVLERDLGDFVPDPVYGPVLAELIE